MQSLAVVLVGLCSLAGWRYATRDRRLFAEEVKSEKIQEVRTRTVSHMEEVLKSGRADFISMSRPFIRESNCNSGGQVRRP